MRYVDPRPEDYTQWRALYGDYAQIVGDPVDEATALAVWAWIMHGTHGVRALFAESDGRLVGFAHFRPFPRTLHGNEACFLDDLYVAPERRGHGVATELIARVREVAARHGWTEVRWVTTPQNASARSVYERVAVRSDLLTYRLGLAPAGS